MIRWTGFELWHSGARAGRMDVVPLPDGGALLGRVLDREGDFPEWSPRPLTPAAGADAVARAAWLFANTWGTYVGFLPPSADAPAAIVRDPAGGLPCYHLRWRGIDVFGSNVDDLRRLPDVTLTADLEAVALAALLPLVRKAATGLREIDEVLPGECRSLGNAPVRRFPWDPAAVARDPLRVCTAEAAALLRQEVFKVTAALIRPYGRALHSLGGLDSSIVLAALADACDPASITCVNFYTEALGGDERGYALRMAAHAGAPLVERRLEAERLDLDVWREQEMGPTPPAGFDALTLAADVAGLADQVEPDVLTYGTGGDSVFFQAPQVFSALDYVAAKQPIRGLGRVALEAAQYGGRSLAATLRAMVAERVRPARCFDTVVALARPAFLAPFLDIDRRAGPLTPARLHPALAVDDRFPKGKYQQLLTSTFFDLESQRYRLSRSRDFLCPLVSQPVVELCLRLPTWQLADGGISRGLARRAFLQDLPRAVAGRTSKSTSGGIYEAAFVRHLPALRETLLDGSLARTGFLDRPALEAALRLRRDQLATTDVATLFDFFAWETWASRWATS